MGRPKSQYSKDLDEAHKVGFEEGLTKGRQEIIDWLEHAYIGAPDRPDRGTPKAEAILQMAEDARNHFVKKQKNGARREAPRS